MPSSLTPLLGRGRMWCAEPWQPSPCSGLIHTAPPSLLIPSLGLVVWPMRWLCLPAATWGWTWISSSPPWALSLSFWSLENRCLTGHWFPFRLHCHVQYHLQSSVPGHRVPGQQDYGGPHSLYGCVGCHLYLGDLQQECGRSSSEITVRFEKL